MDLSVIPTPRVFVDLPRLRNNITTMAAHAAKVGVKLRPHAKTHKNISIARMQLAAGAVGICCAKLGEAEVFADAGIKDIRLPYPVNPANVSRVLALMEKTHLSIIVDDLEVARGWSDAMIAAGKKLDVLVKVDVGFHRCGIDAQSPRAMEMLRAVADLSGLNFRGLLSHAGHSYLTKSLEELEEVAQVECAILTRIAKDLRAASVDVHEISVGSTPTARFAGKQPGITEMRPGNYVFFDRTQVGLDAARLEDCALGVVSTVVSRPVRHRVIFDAGSKTLTNDGLRGFNMLAGHGLVYPSLETSTPDPSIVIERLSEEHATARVTDACTLKPGDRVRIIPNHSCVVANMTDEILGVEGLAVVERLTVDARGRIW